MVVKKLPVVFLTREFFSQRGQHHEQQLSIRSANRVCYRFSEPKGRALETVREKPSSFYMKQMRAGLGAAGYVKHETWVLPEKPKPAQADGETATPTDSGWLIHVGELHERR